MTLWSNSPRIESVKTLITVRDEELVTGSCPPRGDLSPKKRSGPIGFQLRG